MIFNIYIIIEYIIDIERKQIGVKSSDQLCREYSINAFYHFIFIRDLYLLNLSDN